MDDYDLDNYSDGDILLPSQQTDRYRDPKLEPCKELIFEILVDAIRCFQKSTGLQCQKKRLHAEAREWFEGSPALADRFSYQAICDALGIDADTLRARVFTSQVFNLPRQSPRYSIQKLS